MLRIFNPIPKRALPRHVPQAPCKFPLAFRRKRLSLNHSPKVRSQDWNEITPLSRRQWDQLFAGEWPADVYREEIRVRASLQEYQRIYDAFTEPTPWKKTPVHMEFNQDFSMAVITLTQTHLHASVSMAIAHRIYDYVIPEDQKKMALRSNSEVPARNPIFDPDTIAPPRISDPDLQLKFKIPLSTSNGKSGKLGRRLTLAVEVAFTQDSDDLELRAKELLRRTSAKVVLAIDIKEHPTYENPVEESKKCVKGRARLDRFYEAFSRKDGSHRDEKELLEDLAEYADEKTPHSATFIRGLRWAGELTGVIQVFAKDPEIGAIVARTKKMGFLGRQETLDQQWKRRLEKRRNDELKAKAAGHEGKSRLFEKNEEAPKYIENPCLNLKLADFIPVQAEAYQQEFQIDWDALRTEIGEARASLDAERCEKAFWGMQKGVKKEKGTDSEYQCTDSNM